MNSETLLSYSNLHPPLYLPADIHHSHTHLPYYTLSISKLIGLWRRRRQNKNADDRNIIPFECCSRYKQYNKQQQITLIRWEPRRNTEQKQINKWNHNIKFYYTEIRDHYNFNLKMILLKDNKSWKLKKIVQSNRWHFVLEFLILSLSHL